MAIWAYQFWVQTLVAPFDPFYKLVPKNSLESSPDYGAISQILQERASKTLKEEMQKSIRIEPIFYNYDLLNPRRNSDGYFSTKGKKMIVHSSAQGKRVKTATFSPIDGVVKDVNLQGCIFLKKNFVFRC